MKAGQGVSKSDAEFESEPTKAEKGAASMF